MNLRDFNLHTPKTYRNIYSFNILDEIGKGNVVYMLDREKRCVENVNEMEVQTLSEVLNCDNLKDRFEFWVEE